MTAEKASARVEHRRRLQALGRVTAAVAREGNNVLLSMQLTLGWLADATGATRSRPPPWRGWRPDRAGSGGCSKRSVVRSLSSGPAPGLTAEERVFEPLYTTRPHGMGHGLAVARRAVRAHGGDLTVTDRDGPGAEFVVLLPRVTGRLGRSSPRG